MRPSFSMLLSLLLLPLSLHAQRAVSLSDLSISLTTTAADLQATDLFGRSLLFQAVNAGAQKTAALLLERGADPDMRDKQGLTPLALAVAAADQNMAALLLERGADPNAPFPPFSQTALHLLASMEMRRGHVILAKLLLEKGAEPDRKDILGNTPLHYASKSRQKPLKKLFHRQARHAYKRHLSGIESIHN